MKVFGTVSTQVSINPIDVIQGLIDHTLGTTNAWVRERDGEYYRVYIDHFDIEDPISKETYDYIKALQLVKEKLEKNPL